MISLLTSRRLMKAIPGCITRIHRIPRKTPPAAICFPALLFYRIIEKKPDYRHACDEILHTLKSMNFTEVEEQGFMPLYRRERITDAFMMSAMPDGLPVYYQKRSENNPEKIRERYKILYLKTEDKTAVTPMDTGLQRFLCLTDCQRRDYTIYAADSATINRCPIWHALIRIHSIMQDPNRLDR